MMGPSKFKGVQSNGLKPVYITQMRYAKQPLCKPFLDWFNAFNMLKKVGRPNTWSIQAVVAYMLQKHGS